MNAGIRRPPFNVALRFFEDTLRNHGNNERIAWALHENLCLTNASSSKGFRAIYNPRALNVDEAVVAQCYEALRNSAETLGLALVCRLNDELLCTVILDDWDIRPDEQPDVVREDWNLCFGIGGLVETCVTVSARSAEWRIIRLTSPNRPSPLDFVVAAEYLL